MKGVCSFALILHIFVGRPSPPSIIPDQVLDDSFKFIVSKRDFKTVPDDR